MPRVVVTGIGVVSSVGTGRSAFWEALLAGRSGVSPVETFSMEGLPTKLGAPVKDFDPARFVARPERHGRASQLVIAAARLALQDGGFSAAGLGERELGVYVGTTMGGFEVVERALAKRRSEPLVPADVVPAADTLLALDVGEQLACATDALTVPTACAAGNHALAHAYDQIRAGRVDVALAGGSDALSQTAFAGFGRMLALAPERCQPFDLNRQGIVIGEGAGLLLLESEAHARSRGAHAYAEMAGFGLSCDAQHMTIPAKDGVSAALRTALDWSETQADEVDFIEAHGTGTRMNDRTEAAALLQVFGERGRSIPVHALKSSLGHTMGAAAAMGAIVCVMALATGRIPPTLHYQTPDPECPVDCVAGAPREARIRVAMNNALAFGANNAVTVFRRRAA